MALKNNIVKPQDTSETLKSLNGLKGLSGLSTEDYNTWKNQQLELGKLKGNESAEREDRLYKNQLFINEFGLDTFKKYKKEERDAMYKNVLVRSAAKTLYAEDPNYERIMGLSDNSLLELINSGYFNENTPEIEEQKEYYGYGREAFDYTLGLADAVERRRRTRAEDTGNPDYQLTDAELKEVQTRFADIYSEPQVYKDTIREYEESLKGRPLARLGISLNSGSVQDAARNSAEIARNRFSSTIEANQALLDQLIIKDAEAFEAEHNNEIIEGRNAIINACNSGEISYEDVESEFQNIVKDSNYYKAFRDAKELKDLTLEDKIDFISTYRTFKKYRGEEVANQANELAMQNYISDAQSGWDWFKNTQKNIFVGGTAHLANTGIGLITLYKAAQSVDGSGELTNYLQGLDAEGKPLNNWINPQYWNGVDMFNTFSAAEINRARANGGISQFNAIQRAGDEYKFFSWYTANEALKMSKYIWSTGLQTYLTGSVTKGLSGIASRTGLGTLSKGISTVGNFTARQLAALPMAVSMGVNKFNDTKGALDTIINNQIKDRVEDYFRSLDEESLNRYVETYLNSDEVAQDMKKWIAEQKAYIPEGYSLNMSDAELQKHYKQSLKDSLDPIEIAKYIDGNTISRYIEQQYDADRETALKAATKAYMVQATVSQLKESLEFKFIDNWMLAPSVRHLNNADVISRVAYNPAAGYTKTALSKFQRILPYGKQFIGQGLDEGFDGVSEGLSQGFGLGYFNNITGGRYNPESYIASQTFLGNLLTSTREGWKGAVDMATDEGTIYEALIGAISPLTPNINVGGTLSRFNTSSEEWNSLSKAEKLSYYISNPLLQEMADQNRIDREADEMVKVLNKTLKDNKENLLDISALITATTRVEDANLSHDVMLQQDAQAQQLFELAYTLKKSLTDPMLSQAEVYGQTLERMQRYASGNIDEDFITAFVGRKENKGISRKEAKDRIKHQAQKLIDTYESITKVEEQLLSTEAGRNLSENTKKQLVFNALFDEDVTSRLESLEKSINGKEGINKFTDSRAEYSLSAKSNKVSEIQNTEIKQKEKEIKEIEKEIKKIKRTFSKSESDYVNLRLLEFSHKLLKEDLEELIGEEQQNVREFVEDELPLTKEQILALNPSQRAQMLNLHPDNQARYSKEQQAIIKELAEELKFKDSSLLQKIQDSGELYRRRKYNRKAFNRILENHEVFDDYAQYMENAFRERAAEFTNKLLQNEVIETLSALPTDEIKDIIIEKHWGPKALEGYIKHIEELIEKNPEYRDLYNDQLDLVKNLSEVRRLHSATAREVRNVGKKNNRSEEHQSTLAHFIYNLTKDCDTSEQAMEMLEKAIDVFSDEAFKKDLNDVLENLVSYQFLRNATIKNDRETRIAREKQLEEERNRREAEAMALKEAQENEDVEDELNPEEAELLSTEDVDLDSDGNIISPSLETQVQQSEIEYEIESIDTTPSSEDVINDATIHFISINPEFDVTPLKTNGVLQQKVGTREGDLLNSYRQFLQERGIKVQEIIDYELDEIIKSNPDIEVHFMLTKSKGTKYEDPTQTIMFNVIKYTKEVQEIHDESRGKPVTINGTQWLIIGNSGYDPTVGGAMQAFHKLYNKISLDRVNHFASNPDGEYYVSPEYTNIKEITTGSRVKKLESDEGITSRKLSDLLYSEGGYNEERNPMHLGNPKNKISGYSDLKFGIQKFKGFITINTTNDDVIIRPNIPTDNLGAVFLLTQTANGKYLPMYIQPSFYNTISDGKLKERINSLLSDCLSKDYNIRLDAVKKLCSLLVLTEEDNILIGDKNTNVVSIKRNGTVYKTFNLNSPSPNLLGDFFAAIISLNPRINITESTLRNNVTLAEFDEAGALMLDLASLATRNAFYSVYNVGEDGKPIKGETIDIPIEEPSSTTNAKVTVVPYSGKLYKYIDKKYYTFEGQEITDANLIEELDINRIIDANTLAPVDAKRGNYYYIIDDNPDNPIVVKRTNSRHIVKATKETALEIINKYKAEQEAKARAEAAKQELSLEQQFTGEAEDVIIDEVPNVAQQLVGNFTEQVTTKSESVIQPKVISKQEVKEDINGVGGKSLENLHNSDTLTTFVDIVKNMGHKSTLKTIFTAKRWPWTGNPKKLEEFLKSKGIATVGINNIDNWFDMIKNCK